MYPSKPGFKNTPLDLGWMSERNQNDPQPKYSDLWNCGLPVSFVCRFYSCLQHFSLKCKKIKYNSILKCEIIHVVNQIYGSCQKDDIIRLPPYETIQHGCQITLEISAVAEQIST